MQASSPGALVGREKEGELATTSLEFEYLHRKSPCQMLIGGDDISNDVITLGSCLSMFIYIRARFRFALIGGNLTAQSTGNHREVGGGIQIPETYSCKLFFLFPLRRQSAGELARKLPEPLSLRKALGMTDPNRVIGPWNNFSGDCSNRRKTWILPRQPARISPANTCYPKKQISTYFPTPQQLM